MTTHHVAQLPKIIGLLGRSRSGKDTICDYIISSYPLISIEKRRLAQPIKDAVCALYGFNRHQVECADKDRVDTDIGISPRAAMVGITDHVMGTMGREFFSKRLFLSVDTTLSVDINTIIIPDVRYAHDIDYIRSRGGIVIKVSRDGTHDNQVPHYAWEDPIDAMRGDVHVHNDGNIEELYVQVDTALSRSRSTVGINQS